MPPNPQKKKKGNPLLLTLPRHLRKKIYKYFFNSTTIFSGSAPNRPRAASTSLTPNPLALLTVNHQTHADARNLWIPRVEFAFVTERAMFNKLNTEVPDDALAEIRYITIWPLRINEEDVEDWFFHFEKQKADYHTQLCDLRLRQFTVCLTTFDTVLPTLERILRYRPEWRDRLRCYMDDPRNTTVPARRTAGRDRTRKIIKSSRNTRTNNTSNNGPGRGLTQYWFAISWIPLRTSTPTPPSWTATSHEETHTHMNASIRVYRFINLGNRLGYGSVKCASFWPSEEDEMGDVEEEDEDEDVRMRERVLAGEGGRQVGEWLRGVEGEEARLFGGWYCGAYAL
ncbi:uncharacterized protein ASPGLDRAFT_24884 [Aspergillus glaucus CBS 516.65]|uniref:Uncharacterized protein n=1 Tax=Aspergillus glaucus CBS 516.65 TaxID=1160497 RepID=A0A1L9VMA9_ASPGL|nr:hypothetical protein ASPGLDRAFT_24884 [Aspergillus glaucus CBS 516.65]OJJ85010.1 hypothetical protein ASPGLDRAFT_24884 [Aspergillus glaucus CBS 516.65]